MARPAQKKTRTEGKPARPTRKTTLRDVAKHCGVSPMTVSRILNYPALVAKDTSDRVLKAMRELNYTPNLLAKSLRLNRTGTIGMVASDGTHLLFGRLFQSIMSSATSAGYSVLTANTNRNPDLERDSINLLMDKRIDGLLLCAPYEVSNARLERFRDLGVPVVVIMRYGNFPVDCVTSDNYRGGYDAVRYLASRGCRDFYFFNLPASHPNGRERRDGYRQAMQDSGLVYKRERDFHVTPGTASGYQFMRELIAKGVKRGAFVCGCDTLAVGAIKAALEAGIDVPGAMQFCGFDDIDMLDFLNIPLTTMRQRVDEMGREAVRLLLERLEPGGGDAGPVHLRLPCELVVRQSTR